MRHLFFVVVVVILCHVSTCASIAYLGPRSPTTDGQITSILQMITNCDGIPVSVHLLPEDEASAIAAISLIPDLVASVIVGNYMNSTVFADVLLATNTMVLHDDVLVPLFQSPNVFYGGLSLLDQVGAFINTRQQLPDLDISELVLVFAAPYAFMSATVSDALDAQTLRSPTIIIQETGDTAATIAARIDANSQLDFAADGIAFLFPPSEADIVADIIQVLYTPERTVAFLIPNDLVTFIADSLITSPLPKSRVFRSSIEAFAPSPSPAAMPDLAAHLLEVTGTAVDVTREMSFILSASIVIGQGMAHICMLHPLVTDDTIRTDLAEAAGLPGMMTPYSIHSLPVGPTMCIDGVCTDCNQLFRMAFRNTISLSGTIDEPSTASVYDLSTSVCQTKRAQADPPFVVFSVHFTASQVFMNVSDINIARQMGLYSAIQTTNELGGLNGLAVLPQTLFVLEAAAIDILRESFTISNGSFILAPLVSEEFTIATLVDDVLALEAENAIKLLIWGSQAYNHKLGYLPSTESVNPGYIGSIPRMRNLAAAHCKFASVMGSQSVVFIGQLLAIFTNAPEDYRAHMKEFCAQFGISAANIRVIEFLQTGDDIDVTTEAMINMTRPAVAAVPGNPVIALDSIAADTSGPALCALIAEFPGCPILLFSTEPVIPDDSQCPEWRDWVYMLSRWPHYTIDTPIARAFLDSIEPFQDPPKVDTYEKFVQTRLLMTVLNTAVDVKPCINFESFTEVLYSGQHFFVEQFQFGPYAPNPADRSLSPGDVCNCMTKTYFIQQITGDPHNVTYVAHPEFGVEPFLDWSPYCNFFVVPAAGTSLVALWVTLGSTALALLLMGCCCCFWCCFLAIFGCIIARERRQSSKYQVLRIKAEEASRQKSMFVSNMSHELRTPLNAIIGTIDLVKDTALNEDQQRAMEVIGSSSELLLDVVNDVLFASFLASGRIEEVATEFCLHHVIEATTQAACNATARPIEYLIYYLPGSPRRVRCDKRRLSQVMMNVLSNATKYTKGTVRVVVGPASVFAGPAYRFWVLGEDVANDEVDGDEHALEMVGIHIEDSGPGIPDDDRGRVFERFTRITEGVNIDTAGTGLGLHIAKQLVETVLRGTIAADSSPDLGGARLSIAVPMPPIPLSPLAFDGITVVLIDTEPRARHARSMASLLCHAGMSEDNIHYATCDAPVDVQPSHVIGCYSIADDPEQLARLVYVAARVYHVGQVIAVGATFVQHTDNIHVLSMPFSTDDVVQVLTDKAHTEPAPHPTCSPEEHRLKVMVAEDDAINRRTVAAFLKRAGFRDTELFIDGQELVEAAEGRDGPPAMVLIDYHMPRMDGRACAVRLREMYGTAVTVVLMTADVSIQDTEGLFDAVMHKPVRYAAFSGMMKRFTSGADEDDEGGLGRHMAD